MDRLFIVIQHIIPQHFLSRLVGTLAAMQRPRWLKNLIISLFIKQFNVVMAEAEEPDHTSYDSFNAFFTRALKEGARPLADAELLCPADGAVSQLGAIREGLLLQAKGRYYTIEDLLGGDAERAAAFRGGKFITIYLSPKDYHRVHMPAGGDLTATSYIPGKLFSVNGVTAENVDRLFARNERMVCYFETARGPMAMILVGAMIVAGIETTWAGQVAPPPREVVTLDYCDPPEPVSLDQGQEMGRFLLGSTVILLFPAETIEFEERYIPGSPTRMGEALAHYTED